LFRKLRDSKIALFNHVVMYVISSLYIALKRNENYFSQADIFTWWWQFSPENACER